MGFVVVAIIFILILVAVAYAVGGEIGSPSEYNDYGKNERKYIKASSSTSRDAVNRTISELETARRNASESVKTLYAQDIEELRQHADDLERGKWEYKADNCIQKLIDDYYGITSKQYESFNEVEYLFECKRSCINDLKKYYGIQTSKYHVNINPRQYLRQAMGEEFDPSMDSVASFEKKLAELTDHMLPVKKRKQKLYKLIMDYVNEKGSVKKADLERHIFFDYTEAEVKSCYRALIKKNRIVEVKIGNRLFVLLSDKEKEKRKPKSELVEKKNRTKTDNILFQYRKTVPFKHFPDHLDISEEKAWFSKVGKHLAAFADCYSFLMKAKPEDGYESDYLLKAKSRCISEWQNYYGVDLNDYSHTIYPKKYLRFWVGNEYDPCMEDHYSIENKLSNRVKELRPETIRTQRIYDCLRDLVKENMEMPKESLLNTSVEGVSSDEIECAYRALVKSKKLSERKKGDGIIIVLSGEDCNKISSSLPREELSFNDFKAVYHDANLALSAFSLYQNSNDKQKHTIEEDIRSKLSEVTSIS